MKKDLLKKIRKNKELVKELRRAHFMIALLAIGIALLVFVNSYDHTTLPSILTTALGVLSLVIALISSFIVYKLSVK